jgi:WD40 repeat protein
VLLRDVEKGKELRNFEGHTDAVWKVAVSGDGKWAVSGGADKTVRIWRLGK